MKNSRWGIYIFILLLLNNVLLSQNETIDYESPQKFEIGGIQFSGIQYLDEGVLANIAGLQVGDSIDIPGDKITQAIQKLWDQGLFSNITVVLNKTIGKTAFLTFQLQERPRLSKFSFNGVSKGEADDLREKIRLVRGNQVTENTLSTTKYIIRKHFYEKGFYNCKVNVSQIPDTALANHIILTFNVEKGKKYKISEILFIGDKIINNKKLFDASLSQNRSRLLIFKASPYINLRSAMKETKVKKWYRIFKTSRFYEDKYSDDKQKVIEKLNSFGYRDARINKDTVYITSDKTLGIKIWIEPGNKYYFRNIKWVGNSKYSTDTLNHFLAIKKGDVYDQKLLEERLFTDQNSILSLYQDNGYLFFNITPVETQIENDSIDLELRVYEGKQATINNIKITGNSKTNEHVIRREIYTKPGQLYSRSDVMRTMRELAALQYFDPEKMDVKPTPNPADGTVDLEYILEEKPSDQIELSGGWGARMIVGTLGVAFNNFSIKNIFNKKVWAPLPAGDGQRLSLRAQTNGIYYQSYTASFVEPWLGGKKPNSLSLSTYYIVQSNGIARGDANRQAMNILGVSTGIGRRLKWPDDFFTLYNELSYQNYQLNNYKYGYLFSFSDGNSKNISFRTIFGRSSIDQPIYPRRGSDISLSVQLTPPYSLLSNKDYSTLTDKEKYKWIEYHKWSFKSSFITRLAGDLILNSKIEFGFLAMYNKDYGFSPFEGFNMGGDGLISYNLYGKETIALRGYGNGSITPLKGGNIYNKYSFEIRYPLSLNPNATFYVLAFTEGGNCFTNFNEFNPFDLKRSAGVGIRIFLPMFGKLGVDWGYGFDDAVQPGENHSQFHFIIGQNF
ncbi:MAG: outer membrane protein assembly factor BamA [Bacteroidales bacterium]|nr:outer membrane protein assembly factor BamA [Bacteroidales bacterium]